MRSRPALLCSMISIAAIAVFGAARSARADKPHKPVLHGQHWVAGPGKPLGPQAGAQTFARGGDAPAEIFRQPDLAATLRKLVDAEAQALKAGKNRKQAIYAAYDRFYKGDIATELVRSVKEIGR